MKLSDELEQWYFTHDITSITMENMICKAERLEDAFYNAVRIIDGEDGTESIDYDRDLFAEIKYD